MKLTTAGIMRNTLPLAVITVATTMLILSACGGGGGSSSSGGGSSIIQMGGSRQGVALMLTPTVSTFAGLSAFNANADGTGGAASFNAPLASVSDGTNLYIADSANNTIRRVVIATGVVTTLAGSSVALASSLDGTGTAATFNGPSGITTNGTNLYITESSGNIREISPAAGDLGSMTSANAVVSTLVTAVSLNFSNPSGITTDKNVLYVADTAHNKIRIIAPTGAATLATMSSATAAVSTLAGPSGATTTTGLVDSLTSSTSVRFRSPSGIIAHLGYLYVADTGNNRIRKIEINTGFTSSLTAGSSNTTSGFADGPALTASFNGPTGLSTDGTYLYVADTNNNKIRKIDLINSAYTYSLTGGQNTPPSTGGFADGAGANATFNSPLGITTTIGDTKLFVADSGNNTIRQVVISSGQVTTLAGVATSNNPADGTGMAARLGKSQYSTSDGTNLYMTECGPNAAVIRKVVIATGVTTTLAGSAVSATPVDATGTSASFQCPQGITTDGTNLYVTDSVNNTVRMISASGVNATLSAMTSANAVVTTLVGTGTLSAPYGITTDGINLYVADSGNNTIRKIAASGVGATLSNLTAASAVVTSITTASTTPGVADGIPAASASFTAPYGITTNGKSLFVADSSNNKIRMIAPTGNATLSNISAVSAVVSSITGASGVAVTAGFDNGITAASAAFNLPGDITTDGINLYVVDFNNNRIRKIAPTGGATLANITAASAVVSSITGASGVTGVNVLGYADGPGAAATFNGPTGITTDGTSLFVIDGSLGDPLVSGFTSGTIRKIR